MSKGCVVFVDDEEELVSAVVERLRLRGIDAYGVFRSDEALQEVVTRAADVVLLDVRMPGIGGLEILRHLTAMNHGPKVILLSGHGSAEDVEEGLRLGAIDYLQKPVDFDLLLETIQGAKRHDGAGGCDV